MSSFCRGSRVNSTNERRPKRRGMTVACASTRPDSKTPRRSSRWQRRSRHQFAGLGWMRAEGGQLFAFIPTELAAPGDQPGGLWSGRAFAIADGSLSTCTCPAAVPTPEPPRQLPGSSHGRQGPREGRQALRPSRGTG